MSTAMHNLEPITVMEPAAAADVRLAEIPVEKEPVELLPWLPCTLALEVPAVKFTVRTLLELKKGGLIETAWHQSTDIPLRVNGLLMAWTEFEVVGERLAARITDLI